MEWAKILFVLAAILIIFFLYKTVRKNPSWLSSKNLNKSFFTLGMLALGLIGFIGLLVVLLKMS